MAMRVISSYAPLEPDSVRAPEVIRKYPFHLLSRYAGIALLDSAQQAFFCCEQSSAAVHVNASAFEHQTQVFSSEIDAGLPNRRFAMSRHACCDSYVAFPIVVFCPRIESPVGCA